MLNLGLIINPMAGIGGAVAMKGSDGDAVVTEALKRGAIPRAQERVRASLELLLPWKDVLFFCTAAGAMGADLLTSLGFQFSIEYIPHSPTSAQDTESAAQALQRRALGLILFAGGDGTARNMCNVLGEQSAVLGIPAGVKIHSAVYAVSPQAAGKIVVDLLTGAALELSSGSVMDLDENAYRNGNVRAKLHGYMRVPAHPLLQQSKSSMRAAEPELISEIAEGVSAQMQSDVLYILGSGSTCCAIKEQLNMQGSLLGIDAIYNGAQVLTDATEAQVFELLQQHEKAQLLVTAIGGQGHIFGRGNQQLSARVLRRIGRNNITVVASPGKLQSLQGRPLLMDSGDAQLDSEFAGPINVITGYDAQALYALA